jgi:branched-subunit amino acid ABC-type transport system permease component
MSTWLLYALIGTGTGAVYAAIAMGTIVTYRGSGVVNFAQGAMATFPALVFLELREHGELVLPWVLLPNRFDLGDGLPLVPAFVLAVGVAALIGLLADLLIFRHLRGATPLAKVIASVGLSTVLIGLSVLHFGAAPRKGAPILPGGAVEVFGRPVPQDRFWLAGLVVVAGVGLWLLYKHTTFGLATMAAATNERGAEMLGHSARRLGSINWVIAAVLAGTAGILVTPVRGVGPYNYSTYLVAALAAALAARLKSFGWAVAAGIGIGMFSGLAVHLVSTRQVPAFLEGGFETVVPFVVVISALALFSANLPGRGDVQTERSPSAPQPRFNWLVIAAALAVGVVVLAAGESTLRLATIESLIQTVLVLSIVLLAGYVGQVTLAELTFAGFAAFMLARFAGEHGLPFPVSPLLAIAVTTVVGTLVSLPAVRIRGIQLAIVTVAAATAIEEVLFRSPAFTGTGGLASVPRPNLFGLNLGIIPDTTGEYPNRAFGFVVLAATVGAALLVANVRRSGVGRRMLAVRENERAAAAAGISVPRTKLLGAAIGSFLASVAGVLMAYKFVDFSNAGFEASRGLAVVALAYIGGIATVGGAFVAGLLAPAGVIFTLLGSASADLQLLMSGVGLILVAIKFPGGIASAKEPLRRMFARARAVPAARATAPVVATAGELELWMEPEPAPEQPS